ncbi:MAG: hypothetical protein ABIR39_02655 [Nocardioides sp.]|uniref:hypothetical protein n=1 Tax=Nocardioides sp. TaxID=35761 RepID=UPI0032630494
MSQEDGTLVVRVTMNPKLRRVAFASTALQLLWCAVVIVPAFLLLFTRPDPALVVISLILIVWCAWVIRSIVPSARKKYRALSMGMVTLRLDDLGVQVRDVPMQVDPAGLTWTDCAAVVVSKAPKGPEWPVQPDRYVQFVPVSEDRVELKGIRRNDVRTKLLGLSPTASSLTWLELPGSQPDADDVVAWITSRQPTKRVVGAGHSVTDE